MLSTSFLDPGKAVTPPQSPRPTPRGDGANVPEFSAEWAKQRSADDSAAVRQRAADPGKTVPVSDPEEPADAAMTVAGAASPPPTGDAPLDPSRARLHRPVLWTTAKTTDAPAPAIVLTIGNDSDQGMTEDGTAPAPKGDDKPGVCVIDLEGDEPADPPLDPSQVLLTLAPPVPPPPTKLAMIDIRPLGRPIVDASAPPVGSKAASTDVLATPSSAGAPPAPPAGDAPAPAQRPIAPPAGDAPLPLVGRDLMARLDVTAAPVSPDDALPKPVAEKSAAVPPAPVKTVADILPPELARPAVAAALRPSEPVIGDKKTATTDMIAATFASAPTAPATLAVTGAQHAHGAGIDLTRDPGLHRMIDRIEQLRDAADANDTRIRLIPDALGPVEVSVRRAGEGVLVHFTAAEPATRQLIADAQPRLSELAESRGVRIERSTVDSGQTGQNGHSRAQPQAQSAQPRAPARAATGLFTETPDDRIA